MPLEASAPIPQKTFKDTLGSKLKEARSGRAVPVKWHGSEDRGVMIVPRHAYDHWLEVERDVDTLINLVRRGADVSELQDVLAGLEFKFSTADPSPSPSLT